MGVCCGNEEPVFRNEPFGAFPNPNGCDSMIDVREVSVYGFPKGERRTKKMSMVVAIANLNGVCICGDRRETFEDGTYEDECKKTFKGNGYVVGFAGTISAAAGNRTIRTPEIIRNVLNDGTPVEDFGFEVKRRIGKVLRNYADGRVDLIVGFRNVGYELKIVEITGKSYSERDVGTNVIACCGETDYFPKTMGGFSPLSAGMNAEEMIHATKEIIRISREQMEAYHVLGLLTKRPTISERTDYVILSKANDDKTCA